MKQEVKSVRFFCDCCGEQYRNHEGFVSYVGDEDGSQIWNDAINFGNDIAVGPLKRTNLNRFAGFL